LHKYSKSNSVLDKQIQDASVLNLCIEDRFLFQ